MPQGHALGLMLFNLFYLDDKADSTGLQDCRPFNFKQRNMTND